MKFDSSNYSESADLLQEMKDEHPDRYAAFPYGLLHARSLYLSGNLTGASQIYATLAADAEFAQFALLPLARIAATQGFAERAISSYQSYLRKTRYRDYTQVALEALNYCLTQSKAEDLLDTSQIVMRNLSTRRIAQYYMAKSYRLTKHDSLARSLFLTLIQKTNRDEISAQALAELDSIDGQQLSEEEKIQRGKLAFQVSNYDLAKKYLEPVATKEIESAYFYARSLYFLGDLAGAKKALQVAIGLWPEDPMAQLCLYQYGGLCLRDGDYEKAEEIFRRVIQQHGPLQEDATYKLVQTLQAQSRYEEALRLIDTQCSSRNRSVKAAALFLRGRLRFQQGDYRDAVSDFDEVLSLKSAINRKEVLLWKGVVLAKMKRSIEAVAVFQSLRADYDFFTMKAIEKLASLGSSETFREVQPFGTLELCRLPNQDQEAEILSRFSAGDPLAALLYLHLYEEATALLPTVSAETWKILGIDPKNRLQKYLAIAQMAILGEDYPKATYYSEIFIKNLSPRSLLFSLPDPVLKVLFPIPYKEEIERFSRERNVDPLLVTAIMKQESKFKQFARSKSFARGLMQLVPQTATRMASSVGLSNFSVDQLYHPEVNINLGTRYIQEMIREFGSGVELVAAAYNGGEWNVRRWLACSSRDELIDFFSSIDMSETKNYVALVKTNYELYKRIYGNTLQ